MKVLARKVVNWLYFGVWTPCGHEWKPCLGSAVHEFSGKQWWCPACGAER